MNSNSNINSIGNSSISSIGKRRLEMGLEDLPGSGQTKYPFLYHSDTPNPVLASSAPQSLPSLQLKSFSHHSIESLPSHNDSSVFSFYQRYGHPAPKSLRTSPIADVLHNLPCNQPEHCDCKQHPQKSLLPHGLNASGEADNHDDSHDEDSYDADDEDDHHDNCGSGTGFMSPRNITPSTTPLGGSGAHTFGGSTSPTKSVGMPQCNDANHSHKISKEMDNHIKLLTSLGENPACPNCNIPATRRHDKRRWWCKNCTKSFTPFRKGKKLDANGEFIGNTAPQCGRCFQQATRKHDKRRWWCKVCKKPFTPSQFNLGDNSHIIFVMGNSNKSNDDKSPTGNSNSGTNGHNHSPGEMEEIMEDPKKYNSKIELLLNPISHDKPNMQSNGLNTPDYDKDDIHQLNELKKMRGDHSLLEEGIVNSLQNFRNFFNDNKSNDNLPISKSITLPKPSSTSTSTSTSTQTQSPPSCTAQPPPLRPKYNSLKLTNSYDIIDNDEVVKEGLRNSQHHQQLHHHLNNLNNTLRDHAIPSKSGVTFDHRRNVSPTQSTSPNSVLPLTSSSSKAVKTPSEMILDNSFEALVQLNGLEKSQQILYDWLEKSQYTFLFEKILHPEVYKQLLHSKSQN